MEINAFSIRERSSIGKERYKLEDLKKVESLIEAAADKGLNSVEIRYGDLGNFHGHHQFIVADLRARDFNVGEQKHGGWTEILWIRWDLA